MALYLVTAPTVQPVSLSEAKLHCKVDTTVDDALIEGLIRAATEYCETFTHRALCPQTWDDKRDGFPAGDIWLDKPPVTSVTSITYLDGNGDSQVWATDQYVTDLPTGPQAQRGRIYPAYAINYPTTRSIPNAVTIRTVHGYATGAIPDSILSAHKLLVGHWYEHRTAVGSDRLVNIPTAVDALLWGYKAF